MPFVMYFLVIMFASQTGNAQESDESDLTIENRLAHFELIVAEVAASMNLRSPKVVISESPLHPSDRRPMQILRIASFTFQMPYVRVPQPPEFMIKIRPWFLEIENEQAYRHGATHELCHVKLRHLFRGSSQKTEFAAERCVYELVDKDDFFAVIRRIAARRMDRPDLIEISQLPEDEFRAEIRRQIGIREKQL